MIARPIAAAIAALLISAALATAAGADPLAGTGTNVQAISHIDIGDGQKNEIDLAGDYAYVSWDGGMTIVNIADPAHPAIEGVWKCDGGWGDIDLNPSATIAVVANAHGGNCEEGGTAATILDVSDKQHPKAASKIDLDDQIEYVHTTTLDNKTLYLNPQVWLGYPQTHPHVSIYDISDPKNPVRKGFIEFTGMAAAHDTYVDHRPDGKSLFYAASIHDNQVFDITNPLAPTLLQTVIVPDMTISHQAEPNYKRDMILIDDESVVDVGAPVGAVCGHVGTGPASLDVGSIHFFAAAADGTYALNGLQDLGSWNLPYHTTDNTCTGHVFWQAPNEDRLTQAWYSEGAHILDFTDPANVQELGSFKASPSTMYWSAKPHRGYIFATDMDRGLDILRYTGEGGARWPATAGPAEVQRAAHQGVPYVPLAGSAKPLPAPAKDTRAFGQFRFKLKLGRVPGKGKVALVLSFKDAKRKSVAKARFKRAGGKKATASVSGIAAVGSYRWTVKAGRKVLAHGKLKVIRKAGATLSPGASMSVNVR
jgi:hypothetical protein